MKSLLTEYLEASAEAYEAILRYQAVVEKMADHANRLRGFSDQMQDFKATLDTPGEVIKLPRGIVPKDEEAAA